SRRGRGGIGRRAGFRFQCRKTWGFKSLRPHQRCGFLRSWPAHRGRNRSILSLDRVVPMQVTETAAAGLKREYRVVVPLNELADKVNERLDEIKGRVQLRGFRP